MWNHKKKKKKSKSHIKSNSSWVREPIWGKQNNSPTVYFNY